MKKFYTLFIVLLLGSAAFAQEPCADKPTVKDYNGNVYNTVQIGSQCWMKENMRAKSTPTGKRYAVLQNDGKIFKEAIVAAPEHNPQNVTLYGYLYDYAAAKTVCPKGWHLPTQADFEELKSYAQTYACDGNKFNINKALSAEEGWGFYSAAAGGNNIRNSTGFSVTAAGKAKTGKLIECDGFGKAAHLWAADGTETTCYYLSIFTDNWKVEFESQPIDAEQPIGCSVRCLRDNQ